MSLGLTQFPLPETGGGRGGDLSSGPQKQHTLLNMILVFSRAAALERLHKADTIITIILVLVNYTIKAHSAAAAV
jgi:hypothetical protein